MIFQILVQTRKTVIFPAVDDFHPEHISVEPHGHCQVRYLKGHRRNPFNIHHPPHQFLSTSPAKPASKSAPPALKPPHRIQVTGAEKVCIQYAFSPATYRKIRDPPLMKNPRPTRRTFGIWRMLPYSIRTEVLDTDKSLALSRASVQEFLSSPQIS